MRNAVKFFLILFILSITSNAQVKTGLDVLEENDFTYFKGLKVGLLTNPTGINKELKSTIDLFHEAENVDLISLFGPEHGVRGNFDAGAKIDDYIDKQTGIKVFSLYGKNRKPTEKMLKGIDVLVYDIQDIGCRSYTYISSMGMAMEACAENNIKFVVLDRPNPLGGKKVEGNVAEDGFLSFISQFKIPYVYGLTAGEIARFINSEVLSEKGLKCNLDIIKMEGWKREMTFDDTGLYWVPTSPHIPHTYSSYYYVMTGIIGEFRNAFSIGVGYTLPFQTVANEWLNGNELAKVLNSYNLPGIKFREIHYTPYYAFGQGNHISGVQIYITDYDKIDLMKTQFYILKAIKEVHPDKNVFDVVSEHRKKVFDKVVGSDNPRKYIEADNFEKLFDYLDKDIESFKKKSLNYYLYN